LDIATSVQASRTFQPGPHQESRIRAIEQNYTKYNPPADPAAARSHLRLAQGELKSSYEPKNAWSRWAKHSIFNVVSVLGSRG